MGTAASFGELASSSSSSRAFVQLTVEVEAEVAIPVLRFDRAASPVYLASPVVFAHIVPWPFEFAFAQFVVRGEPTCCHHCLSVFLLVPFSVLRDPAL